MRTLHLIRGPSSPHAGEASREAFGALSACARAIDSEPPGSHRVLLLGDRRAERDAALAGLRIDRRVRPPSAIDALAWSLVRRERGWMPEQVCVWSPGLARLAALVSCHPVTGTPWSNGAIGEADHPGKHHKPAHTPAPPTQTLNVPVPPTLAAHDRESLRAWLGASPRDRVIALLSDPPAHGDARRFAFILGLVEVGVGPVVGMMSAGSSRLARGRRFHRLAVRRSPLVALEGSVIPWLHAVDVALLEGPECLPSRSAAARAIELGIPLVGPDWLLREHAALAGSSIHATDGRTRTLLPALLKALGDTTSPLGPGAP